MMSMSKSSDLATADRLWRKFVIKRAGGYCEKCPKVGTECHHIARRSLGVRHNPANGILLCGDCHRLAHGEIELFAEWLEGAFPHRYKWTEANKHGCTPNASREIKDTIINLKLLLKEGE